MTRNFPASLDYLGSEAIDFNKSQHLYLKPMAVIRITVHLPKMTIPGQSISNWDLMERLRKAVDPIQMDSIKVRESNMDSVIFEAELLSVGIMTKTMKILDGLTMKVSGFAEVLRVKTKEAKLDFPSRHDWDLWYMKNKMDETKPGERPDTVYLAKIPVKWFNDGVLDLPSEKLLFRAMETFGKLRAVDIPICDPLRTQMSAKCSGIQMKGFGLGQDVFFEAYVQYMDYKGFATAMDNLRNKKWAKRIEGRFFQANVKVDFDKTRHLSEAMIAKRADEKRKIEKERMRQEEEEMNERLQEEMKLKEARDEKDKRREDRERKRREKREIERLADEEKRRLEAEKLEKQKIARQNRKIEAERLIKFLFNKIEAREERRKRREEEKLKEELKKVKTLVTQPAEHEDALRQALLKQRELRMRERLKEKMSAIAKEKEQGKKKHRNDRKSRNEKKRRAETESSEDNPESDESSSTSSERERETYRRNDRRKTSDSSKQHRSHRHRSRSDSREDRRHYNHNHRRSYESEEDDRRRRDDDVYNKRRRR